MGDGKHAKDAKHSVKAGASGMDPGAEARSIALKYLLFGFLWILLTDRLLLVLLGDAEAVQRAQTIKGWFYVAITTLLVYFLVYRQGKIIADYIERLRASYRDLSDTHAELEEVNASLEETQVQLIREKHFAEHLVEAAPVLFATWDERGRLTSLNAFGEKLYGYTSEELEKKHWSELALLFITEEDRTGAIDRLQYQIDHDDLKNLELQLLTKHGGLIDTLMNTRRLTNSLGETYYLTVGTDITQQNRMLKNVERMAYSDYLTVLGNRRLMEIEVRACVERALPFSLVFLDIDDFKMINDHLGHGAGDQYLQAVARRLKSAVHPPDLISRMGGDEFGVLLRDVYSHEDLERQIQLLRSAIGRTVSIDGEEKVVSCSYGVTKFPEDGKDAIELFKNADMALFEAKTSGKNTCVLFSESLSLRQSKRMQITREIDRALTDDGFHLLYQPYYDLREGGQLTGMEVLIRWHHPEMGFMKPDEFIPIAEETGQILSIDRWVIDRAFRAKKELEDKGLGHVKVSINLSARTLMDPDLLLIVEKLLEEHGVDPVTVLFEITETALIGDVEYAIVKVARLRALGVGIALDDFGTGYSSLTYLRKLPILQVKLDRSYVGKITDSEMDRMIIKNLLALCRDLGYTVVAEGVETEEQLEILREEGCPMAQGYFLARPGPLADLLSGEMDR
jgi:diguanylate cyclase (GGDEF)-like protein/PAS domain S-box-containing protein